MTANEDETVEFLHRTAVLYNLACDIPVGTIVRDTHDQVWLVRGVCLSLPRRAGEERAPALVVTGYSCRIGNVYPDEATVVP